jgi:adenylate kinase
MSINVVMLGPPGAGKGTQGERIAREHGVPKVSTGDILRECIQTGSDLGRAVGEVMAAGRLVGDDLMIDIVSQRLKQPDATRGFVLDGFPRTVVQARALDAMMVDRGLLAILAVDVPTDVLVMRLATRRICGSCGLNAPPATPAGAPCPRCGGAFVMRSDDQEGVIRERLRVYEQQTQPLMAFYGSRATFHRIDGNRPPDVVFAALEAALAPKGVTVRTPGVERTS